MSRHIITAPFVKPYGDQGEEGVNSLQTIRSGSSSIPDSSLHMPITFTPRFFQWRSGGAEKPTGKPSEKVDEKTDVSESATPTAAPDMSPGAALLRWGMRMFSQVSGPQAACSSVRQPAPASSGSAVQEGVSNLGPREVLSTLADEFKYNASFGQKVGKLEEMGYVGWRRVRGDGNCFYRAIGYGLMEQVYAQKDKKQRVSWHLGWSLPLQQACVAFDLHSDELAVHDWLLVKMSRMSNPERGEVWRASEQQKEDFVNSETNGLYESFSQPNSEIDLGLIRAMRGAIAMYLRKHSQDQTTAGGLTFEMVCQCQGYEDVEDFCKKVVDPMGVEAQDIVLNAASKAFKVNLQVAILDRGDADLNFQEYIAGENCPTVHVQLRPGHYELLYKQERPSETIKSDISADVPVANEKDSINDCQFVVDGYDGHDETMDSVGTYRTLLPQRPISSKQFVPSAQVRKPHFRPPTFGPEDDSKWSLSPTVPTSQKSDWPVLPGVSGARGKIASRQAVSGNRSPRQLARI